MAGNLNSAVQRLALASADAQAESSTRTDRQSQRVPMAMPNLPAARHRPGAGVKRLLPAENSDSRRTEHHAIADKTVTHATEAQRTSSASADRHRGSQHALAVFSPRTTSSRRMTLAGRRKQARLLPLRALG